MNERMKKMMVLGILILAAGICHGGEQTDGGASRITGEATAVGRDDPFAGGFGGVGAEPKPVISVSGEEIQSKPSLFVRTVTLKFLNAANLKNCFG